MAPTWAKTVYRSWRSVLMGETSASVRVLTLQQVTLNESAQTSRSCRASMGWGTALLSCSECTGCPARSCTSARGACTSRGKPLRQAPFFSPLARKGWLVNPRCSSAIDRAAHPSAPQPFLTCWERRKPCDLHLSSTLGALLLASSPLCCHCTVKITSSAHFYPHGEEVLFNCLDPTAKWKIKIIYRNRAFPWLSTIYMTTKTPEIQEYDLNCSISKKQTSDSLKTSKLMAKCLHFSLKMR